MQPEDIKITIGSDPEFVIMCGDSVENALEIFKRVSKMEHCCECPHPNGEDIANIYEYSESYGGKKQYIKDALTNIARDDIFELINIYPFSAVNAIFEINEYKLEKLENKHIQELVQGYYYEIYDKRLSYNEIKEKIYEEDILELIKKALNKEPIYIHLLYSLLNDENKKKYSSILIIDDIMEFYKQASYPNLDELPDEIQESIKQEIIDNYETDCESCDVGESYFCTTELGCDGQSALGEMRPKEGNNPIEHFNEILKLMEDLNDLLSPEIICYGDDELQVKAGSIIEETYERYELGGHIHIGFEELKDTGKGLYIQKNIKYTLAVYVGIPLTLIEYTSEAVKRHKSYGQFASVQNGEKYFGTEFRMPSSWLVSPQITIGALSLAYVVAHEYIKVMFSSEEYKTKVYKMDENVKKFNILYEEALRNEYFTPLEKEMSKLHSEIQQMELYPEYKEYIDYIFDMIEKHKVWESQTNILPRWAELW